MNKFEVKQQKFHVNCSSSHTNETNPETNFHFFCVNARINHKNLQAPENDKKIKTQREGEKQTSIEWKGRVSLCVAFERS